MHEGTKQMYKVNKPQNKSPVIFTTTNKHSLQTPVSKKTKITFRSAFALLRAANNSSRISGSMP